MTKIGAVSHYGQDGGNGLSFRRRACYLSGFQNLDIVGGFAITHWLILIAFLVVFIYVVRIVTRRR